MQFEITYKLVCFPNAKINLGLRVKGKRADGYHDLETLFCPITWCDALEAVEAGQFSFHVEGMDAASASGTNLCVKAFLLLQQELKIPPVSMCLLKRIPIGAGLGGGSADAAFTLMLLNNLFELGLAPNQLMTYATQLGSDCAFFIHNTPCIATGRGELLQPITLDMASLHVLIVYPQVRVNTAWAYQALDELPASSASSDSLREIISMPVSEWKSLLKNDFETVVFRRHPVIASIKDELYRCGALYASLSGSGSSVFGIFSEAPDRKLFAGHQTFTARI